MTPLRCGQVPGPGESINGGRARPDYEIDEATDCWNWLKALSPRGYPTGQEYRVYYALANGPIPPEHDVHHLCKNTRCVNPDHLEAVHRREHDALHFLGERNGLTLDDVRTIRHLGLTTNLTTVEVGAMYGVSRHTIRDYWSGRRWALEFGGEIRPQGRVCEHCGIAIAPKVKRGVRTCSPRCQYHIRKKAG